MHENSSIVDRLKEITNRLSVLDKKLYPSTGYYTGNEPISIVFTICM